MLNEKLKELRENVELSQADVADLMFCSRSLIAKWEQGRANPSDSDLKSLSDIYKCSYEELLNETKNNDISSFSFTIKSVFKYYSYSFSYLFFPYIFSLILIYLLFGAIGVVLGLSSNGNNAMECFIVIWIVIIALMPLLVFVAYKTKKRAQGGVGLPLTILDHKELETVSINHNENTIDLIQNNHVIFSSLLKDYSFQVHIFKNIKEVLNNTVEINCKINDLFLDVNSVIGNICNIYSNVDFISYNTEREI